MRRGSVTDLFDERDERRVVLGRADGPGLHRRKRRQRAGDADRGQRCAERRDRRARDLRIEDRDQPAFEL